MIPQNYSIMITSENTGEIWRTAIARTSSKQKPTKQILKTLQHATHTLPYVTRKEMTNIIWLTRHFLGPHHCWFFLLTGICCASAVSPETLLVVWLPKQTRQSLCEQAVTQGLPSVQQMQSYYPAATPWDLSTALIGKTES